MFIKSFKPKGKMGLLKNEGDVEKARDNFLTDPSNNLKFLIKNRYNWMNKYINENDAGLELGCGAGFSKLYIKSKNYLISDNAEHDWLDVKAVDAINTPFANDSFNFVIAADVVHHIAYPIKLLEEISRILKPNGIFIIFEPNGSFFTRLLLRLTNHEGYNYLVNIFDRETICTDPEDLWSGNNVIANMLFDDKNKFHREIPYFEIIHSDYKEFLIYLNSGGIIAKTFFIPLPETILNILKVIDSMLIKVTPRIFALSRQIVLQNIK